VHALCCIKIGRHDVDTISQRHIQADIERGQDGHCRTNEHRRVRSIATAAE
jgi:hypothetical protein